MATFLLMGGCRSTYVETWTAGCERALAATAFTNYRIVLRRSTIPRIGGVILGRLTPSALTTL